MLKYKNLAISLIFILLLLMIISASYLPIKVLPKEGNQRFFGKAFNYEFRFAQNSNCGNVVFSDIQNAQTSIDGGEAFINISIPAYSNLSSIKYICEYRNGGLRATHALADGFFDNLYATNINISNDLIADGNITATSFLGSGEFLTDIIGGTNTSYLTIDQFNVTNETYRTIYNLTLAGNITSDLDFCIAAGNCLSGLSAGDNSSLNQTYLKTINDLLYLDITTIFGNTSVEIWDVIDNDTFALNQTLTDIWSDIINVDQNATGLIINWSNVISSTDWNSTGLVINWSNIDDWNLTGLIQDWNTTGYIQNWSIIPQDETDSLAYNGTLAYNQTLTDMWTPFLNTTNLTYEGYNSTGLIRNWNISSWIIDWNASSLIIDWNTTGYLRNWGIADWNSSGLIQDWNTTGYLRDWSGTGDNSSWNQSYAETIFALNSTLTDIWSDIFAGNSSWNQSYAETIFALNSTLTDIWSDIINVDYNATGLIRDWNISEWIIDWNSTGYIRDWSGTGDNSSWNQTYSKEVNDLLYAVLGSGNTSLQMFEAVDNGTFLKISQWNSTNSSYALNQTLTDIWGDIFAGNVSFNQTYTNVLYASLSAGNSSWNQTYAETIFALNSTLTDIWSDIFSGGNSSWNQTYADVLYSPLSINDTGLIRNWNVSGWIRNQTLVETNWNSSGLLRSYDVNDWNSSGLIQDWNTTGYLRDWSGTGDNSSWNQSYSKTINDLLYAVLGSGNTSIEIWDTIDNGTLAYNQTLTDMWTPFLNTTNITYNGYNSTGLIQDWNSSGLLRDWNVSEWIRDWGYLDTWTANITNYFTKAQWNVTNSSYLLIDQFNVTNTTYRTDYNNTFVTNDLNVSTVDILIDQDNYMCFTQSCSSNITNNGTHSIWW